MNKITFPILNLNLNINPVAFKIFNVEIYWYAIFITCGFAIAMLIYYRQNNLYNIKFEDILDLSLYIIPISIISARAYYVLFKLDYYLTYPSQILNLRNGGLAIYGGLIGGLITCIIFCKKRKINLLDLLDYIVPAVALAQSLGRWGNFVNKEAYGTKTMLPWRMGIIKAGTYIEVHPTFLYESIITLLIFIILTNVKKRRKFNGQITYIYLIMYSFARTIIEGIRTDSLMLGPFRISQILSVAIFIVFTIIYYIEICRKKTKFATNENKK